MPSYGIYNWDVRGFAGTKVDWHFKPTGDVIWFASKEEGEEYLRYNRECFDNACEVREIVFNFAPCGKCNGRAYLTYPESSEYTCISCQYCFYSVPHCPSCWRESHYHLSRKGEGKCTLCDSGIGETCPLIPNDTRVSCGLHEDTGYIVSRSGEEYLVSMVNGIYLYWHWSQLSEFFGPTIEELNQAWEDRLEEYCADCMQGKVKFCLHCGHKNSLDSISCHHCRQ